MEEHNPANENSSARTEENREKAFLMRAWEIDRGIERKIEERERINARLVAGRHTVLTGAPRNGRRGHDWLDALSAVGELTEEINEEISALCRVKKEVNAAISAVEDDRCRELLELRYRNYLPWEQIAERMNYDLRWVYRLHGRALRQIHPPRRPAGRKP